MEGHQYSDIVYLGYNLDGWLALKQIDEIPTQICFPKPADIDVVLRLHNTRAGVYHTSAFPVLLAWGTLAYTITPAGARKLLEHCYPLNPERLVRTPDGLVNAFGLDGMIMAAVQRQELSAKAYFPPLAIGPNDKSTSDVVEK
jgi:hypothetical protein